MHPSPEQMHAARLANLEAALAAFFRSAVEQGYDGLTVAMELAEEGQPSIDLTYTVKGMPMGGQSL